MRNKLSILFVFISSLVNAQVYFQGDSIVIEEPAFSNVSVHQIHIQNADQLNESVYFWDADGRGSFLSSYCNVIVGRTAFGYDSIAIPEWSVKLERQHATVSIRALPGKKVRVDAPASYELRVSHIGGHTYFPPAVFAGEAVLFIPNRIPGAQVVTVRVLGSCPQVVGKIIYLN